MPWLLALETDPDPIPACRLLNIFRRKGVKIVSLTLTATPAGFSVMAVVETPESEVDHLFHFLRRTEGIQHVTCYRHAPSGETAFLWVDAGPDSPALVKLLESYPGSRLVFAGQGKVLLELPAETRGRAITLAGSGSLEFLPFARAQSTRTGTHPELAGMRAP